MVPLTVMKIDGVHDTTAATLQTLCDPTESRSTAASLRLMHNKASFGRPIFKTGEEQIMGWIKLIHLCH
jgi:hypothetical protein